MQAKGDNFKERLLYLVQWKEIRVILIINFLISILIFIIITTIQKQDFLTNLFKCFLFSYTIGTVIYFFVLLTEITSIENIWLKSIILTGILILGGWTGTLLGTIIYFFVFGLERAIDTCKSLFNMNTLLALIFGTVAVIYYLLRDQLELTAARLSEKEITEQRWLRLKTRMELEALRAKVNPHFLFNTLNSIASLIPVDPHRAEEMVQRLSHLFRYTLDASNHEKMQLAEELEFIREYLEIEKVRLSERLSYKIEIDEELAHILIPSLLLQPVVENSVKYGIASSKKGGFIHLKCNKVNDYCQIEIIDTGTGYNPSQVKEGFGLSAIRELLSLNYGTNHEFKISTDNGVRVLIRIPFSEAVSKGH